MTTSVKDLLLRLGPCSTRRLADELRKEGLSADAARKRISRAPAPVKKLSGIRLGDKSQFVFLEDQFTSEAFQDNLIQALKDTNSSYGRYIQGLETLDGAAFKKFTPIMSGLPLSLSKGHPQHTYIENKLLELPILVEEPSSNGDIVALAHDGMTDRRRALYITEAVFLEIIKQHFGCMGITSFDAAKIRNLHGPLPQIGQYAWDFSGPSYLMGLSKNDKSGSPTPAFVAGDIILGKEINLDDLNAFFSKNDTLIAQRRNSQLLTFFAADSFSLEALNELRRRRHLIITPAGLYGNEFAKHLRELTQMIEHASAVFTKEPQKFVKLIDILTKIEGAALNLRGVVLEFILARLYSNNGYNIDIRQQIVSSKGEQAEIDVKATNHSEVVCVECKAKSEKNFVSKQELEEWESKSLPRIKDWLKSSESLPAKKRFVFATSTDFDNDAKEFIKTKLSIHKKQPIEFVTGAEIVQWLKGQNESSLKNVFNEHFSSK